MNEFKSGLIWAKLMTASCLLSASVATSSWALELAYEGSFLSPSPEPSYTAYTICFVPAGTTRPGNAQPVSGPTLIVGWESRNAGNKVKEFTIPALVKTGTMNYASWVLNANGGTDFLKPANSGDRNTGPYDVDSAGYFWGPAKLDWGEYGLRSDRINWLLGGTSTTGLYLNVAEAGWGGTRYPLSGVLRRGDGAGHDLTVTDGTKNGAKFIHSSGGNAGTCAGRVVQSVRNGNGGNMVSTVLFAPTNCPGTAWGDNGWDVTYVRDTCGSEWFLVFRGSLNGTYKSSTWYFYRGDLADGLGHCPNETINVHTMITNGVGYSTGGAPSGPQSLRDIAVDWQNSRLYLLDSLGYSSSRVHVFTLKGLYKPRGSFVLIR